METRPAPKRLPHSRCPTYLSERPEQLRVFFRLTGLTPDPLRQSAAEPDFLVGVLDHALSDERLIIAFAENAGIPPESIGQARDRLGGALGEY